MNTVACIFLKNLLNLPITEGHFVIVDKNSVDVPWLQSNATTLKCYDDDIPIHPFSCIVGRINGISDRTGMTRMEFYLPLQEFLPSTANNRMLINSSPCAGIRELIKTPYIGCVKNDDVIDLAFVFSPVSLENGTHAVAAGMHNVFICRYMYRDKDHVHVNVPVFASFVVTDIFDDPFPKRVWDGIILIQEICRSLLSTYSAKQGDYFYSSKKVNFLADVWKYFCAMQFHHHIVRRQLIGKRTIICQRLDDGVVAKSVRDTRPVVQYVFQTECELNWFRGIFGRTTTFGKRSRRPTVGNTKYLQHLDIINVIIPSTQEAVEAGKANGVVLRYNGKELVVKVNYHKFIYKDSNRTVCPCRVLNAAIAYSATLAAANHSANVLQIDALFRVDDMILEITAVRAEHVEAAIISPSVRIGEILIYDNKEFVAQQVRQYIRLT